MLEPDKVHGLDTDGQLGSRTLLGATLAYALLGGVALAAFGTLPAASETGAELVAWLREHREPVGWGGVYGRSRSLRRRLRSWLQSCAACFPHRIATCFL